MTVRFYKSTDASAPSLSGTVGSLISLLDACLVNGYGSQSAAGWTKPFSGTNKAVYRNTTSGGTGLYLNVQDNGPGAGGAREARIWGYTACTAQDTGTGQFPTTAQMANGLFVRKSSTADSTARAWYLLADATVFYLFIENGDWTGPAYVTCNAFGDFYSYKSGDTANCQIAARSAENTTGAFYESLPYLTAISTPFATPTYARRYIAQNWTGIGGAIAHNLAVNAFAWGTYTAGTPIGAPNAMLAYPNGADSALELSPMWLIHDNGVHGYYKGLWAPCHYQPLGHGDTFSGTGNMSGKSFMALNIHADTNSSGTYYNGQIIIETSDTWS